MPTKLARFRVDPSKVRVSIQPRGPWWYASVSERRNPKAIRSSVDSNPAIAVLRALEIYDECGYEGSDPAMCFTYEHPMRT
jgi:hypothetical protein